MATKKKAVVTPCLEFAGTVVVSGCDKFVAADNFKIDTWASAVVRIGYMNQKFQRVMLGKVETRVPTIKLNIHRLMRDTLDQEIRDELTPETEVTTLTHLWHLLTKQGHGRAGTLLTNGRGNRFYIMGTDGELSVVAVNWLAGSGYWCVYAYSVTDRRRWSGGCQVFARKVG